MKGGGGLRRTCRRSIEATEKAPPGGHLGTPDDVADAVLFLASARARHINGVNITIDGGFLKRIDY